MKTKTNHQTVSYTMKQYVLADCSLLVRSGLPDFVGLAIYEMTAGRPCNSCSVQMNKCQAYRKLQDSNMAAKPVHVFTETVRQEAARRNLSISEVRRQRNVLMNYTAEELERDNPYNQWMHES